MLRKSSIYKLPLIFAILMGLIFALFNYTYVSDSFSIRTATQTIEVTWPLENANLFENQMFTADLASSKVGKVGKVRMFWEVEDGVMSEEMISNDNSSFKSEVDTSKWDWKKDNKYTLVFTAKDENDITIATTSIFVYVGGVSELITQTQTQVAKVEKTEVGQNTAAVYQPIVNTKPQTTATGSRMTNFKVEWVLADIKSNQKFIYKLSGYNENDISAYWSSEGGHKNLIYKTDSTVPFMAVVNIFGWRWKGKGPYTISFSVADKNTSTVIGTENFDLYWKGEPGNSEIDVKSTGSNTSDVEILSVVSSISLAATTSTSVSITSKSATNNPVIISPFKNATQNIFKKNRLFTPIKPAAAQSLTSLNAKSDIDAINFVMNQPSSVWLNGDAHETDVFIQDILTKAKSQKQIPTFVLYNIPNRDCGSYSSGGTDTIENYKTWIDSVSENISQAEAIVIVEPDALAQLNCLPEKDRAGRVEMLKYAVETFKSVSPQVLVYIDAGHPFWVNAEEMSDRLTKVGVESARGFALNVSNYISTSDNITYGNYISNLIGGKKYVIDTSRNGKGPSPTREWCNPSGRSLGDAPALTLGQKGHLDATLWIKFPGESDGTCNGGPNAGGFWTQYAIDLYKNR